MNTPSPEQLAAQLHLHLLRGEDPSALEDAARTLWLAGADLSPLRSALKASGHHPGDLAGLLQANPDDLGALVARPLALMIWAMREAEVRDPHLAPLITAGLLGVSRRPGGQTAHAALLIRRAVACPELGAPAQVHDPLLAALQGDPAALWAALDARGRYGPAVRAALIRAAWRWPELREAWRFTPAEQARWARAGDAGAGEAGEAGDAGAGEAGEAGDAGAGEAGEAGDAGAGEAGEAGDAGEADSDLSRAARAARRWLTAACGARLPGDGSGTWTGASVSPLLSGAQWRDGLPCGHGAAAHEALVHAPPPCGDVDGPARAAWTLLCGSHVLGSYLLADEPGTPGLNFPHVWRAAPQGRAVLGALLRGLRPVHWEGDPLTRRETERLGEVLEDLQRHLEDVRGAGDGTDAAQARTLLTDVKATLARLSEWMQAAPQ